MGWMSPDALLTALMWILGILSALFLLMLAGGGWLQYRHQRWNRHRIACHQKWEKDIVHFLYGSDQDIACFGILTVEERHFFIPFLLRVLGTLAGTEGEAVRQLYHRMGLSSAIEQRLRSRRPKLRAMAALEVGSFGVESLYDRLQDLLADPVPHVAHAAARGLGNSQRLAYAEPVLRWVLHQEVFQQERLIWILESFGAGFMRWLEARMDASQEADLGERKMYALLAASTRRVEEPSRLIAMLDSKDLEVESAAIKALGALGSPEALPFVLPRVSHSSWVIRAQAAKAIGILAGAKAIPSLQELICDPRFEVRRNAAMALSHLGAAGVKLLRDMVEDPSADPFARDLARERLQWVDLGGAP